MITFDQCAQTCKVGDVVLLGRERNTTIWQKSAKLEGGDLSLGVGNPHSPYETLLAEFVINHLAWEMGDGRWEMGDGTWEIDFLSSFVSSLNLAAVISYYHYAHTRRYVLTRYPMHYFCCHSDGSTGSCPK